ncbi:hypothetical protein A5647_14290 [Mycobacterium sp. 1100029.7]|nr:hypothetical protein A5647_14290 [Mycobacterium sp. 1100029.7]
MQPHRLQQLQRCRIFTEVKILDRIPDTVKSVLTWLFIVQPTLICQLEFPFENRFCCGTAYFE